MNVMCSECSCVVEMDGDGELVSQCPSDSLSCPHTAYQCDELYLPLDFENDGTDRLMVSEAPPEDFDGYIDYYLETSKDI